MLELFPYSEPDFFVNKFDETFTPKALQVVLQGPNNQADRVAELRRL